MESGKIECLLETREVTHGNYGNVAQISQAIKSVMRKGSGWEALTIECKESLELIAVKIARIVNNGCGKKDSMLDISGYAELAVRSMHEKT